MRGCRWGRPAEFNCQLMLTCDPQRYAQEARGVVRACVLLRAVLRRTML